MSSVPNVGDLWRLNGKFYSDAALTIPADPTTTTLTITDPFGTIVTVGSPTRDSMGVFHYDWTPLVGGAHEIVWKGTGAVQVVSPETIIVRSGLDQALATTQYIQGVLGSTGSGNPDLIARLALVCSEHIMQHCNRRFLPIDGAPSTKRFRARAGDRVISLVPWDFQSAASVTVVVDAPSGGGWTLISEDDFFIAPENSVFGVADRIMLQMPLPGFRAGASRVDVTATWGWPALPPQVMEACAYWVRDLLRAVSAYPQAQQLEEGTQIAADGVVPAVCRQLLSPFRHVVVA